MWAIFEDNVNFFKEFKIISLNMLKNVNFIYISFQDMSFFPWII